MGFGQVNSTKALVILVLLAVSGTGMAASVNERLDTIERKLDARGLIDMLNRIEQLQQDIQQLRGEIEMQAHTLDQMKRQQREQYLDIDRRLQQLESAQAPGAAAPVADAGASAPAGAAPVTPVAPVAGTAAPAPVASADPAREQAEYDTALAILRDGRYSDAALAFKQFITNYPGSSYADNAYYWLGETYYVTREFDQAQATFNKLVADFPNSPKVADSRLKLGYIHYENKDWKAARTELEAVTASAPASTAARLANERLARMKKEGR
jgi:tol-pal system protein YbgF